MKNNKPKILVVEDTKIAQTIAKMVLNSLGCQIDIAETGQTALNYVKQTHYDLILMDIGLPDTDGFTVTETIRNSRNKNADVPIVALTAHADAFIKERSHPKAMSEITSKPFTEDKAKALLAKYLNYIYKR